MRYLRESRECNANRPSQHHPVRLFLCHSAWLQEEQITSEGRTVMARS